MAQKSCSSRDKLCRHVTSPYASTKHSTHHLRQALRPALPRPWHPTTTFRRHPQLQPNISQPDTPFIHQSTHLTLFTSREMGWLPWSSSSESPKSSDGGRIAPDRSSRQRCYEGRDLFFACLDRNDILDAVKDDKEARRRCGSEIAQFESACSQSWVCTLFFLLRWLSSFHCY